MAYAIDSTHENEDLTILLPDDVLQLVFSFMSCEARYGINAVNIRFLMNASC